MKTIFLDCGMGAAGDMLTAALLELVPDREQALEELNRLGIPGVRFEAEKSVKCGITGTHMRVFVGEDEEGEMHQHHDYDHPHDHSHVHEHDHQHDHEHHHGHDGEHHHHHSGMEEIAHRISHLQASDAVKEQVQQVYARIAQAESQVHGVPVTQIHFHEVGTLDALADVTAVCLLLEKLGWPRLVASPIHVGSGHVHCAHGILPVPAPATAQILQGLPIYGGAIQGELCTPTGAALLKQFVSEFGNMPVMTVEAVGYGMGKKDFAMANCVRAILGQTEASGDTVAELSCNLDDMTGEELGFAMEALLAQGALDVFTLPIGMKKSRPGVMLTVLCRPEDKAAMARAIFCHTTTLGIRESERRRYTLERSSREVSTPCGTVHIKTVSGFGVERSKPEYEDLARIAREQGMPLAQVKALLK